MPHHNPPLSLRQMAGLPPTASLPAATTALLLIDYQNEYRSGRLPLPGVDAAAANGRRLLAWAAAAGIAVWHIAHHAASTNSPIFAPGSDGAAFLAELQPQPGQGVIIKALANAFAGTGLADALRAQGIRTVVIAGLMTHNCVSSTARAAVDLGLTPLIAGDACATRDLPDGLGGQISAAEVHRACLAGLADRLVEVRPTAEVLTLGLTA